MTAARALLTAVAVALTIAAPAGAQEQRPPGWAPPPAPPCPRIAECGILKPPLVEADPLGQSPHATYAYVKAASEPAFGTVAFNPGGPGISGIQYAKDMATFLGPKFNILIVDPRGVGASGPLTCGLPDDIFIQPFSAQLRGLRECGERLGDRADAYGTVAAADDLEAARRRLGIQQLDLYGQSYGTVLMTTYARRYPASVRSMLLSGAYPYTRDPWALDRAAGMRSAIRLLCARSGGRCDGAAVLADISTLARRVRRDPIPYDLTYGFRRYPQKLDELALVYLVFNAGYEPRRLARLPGILREAVAGDTARLVRLARRDALTGASLTALSGSHAVILSSAVACREGALPFDFTASPAERRAIFVRERDRIGRVEPFSADGWAKGAGAGGITCLDWPAHDPPVRATGGYPKVPTLVVSGDLDWVTPTSDGRQVAQTIPGARFAEVPNVVHVPELHDPTGCVGETYWSFLRHHKVPGLGCLEHVPAVQVR